MIQTIIDYLYINPVLMFFITGFLFFCTYKIIVKVFTAISYFEDEINNK